MGLFVGQVHFTTRDQQDVHSAFAHSAERDRVPSTPWPSKKSHREILPPETSERGCRTGLTGIVRSRTSRKLLTRSARPAMPTRVPLPPNTVWTALGVSLAQIDPAHLIMLRRGFCPPPRKHLARGRERSTSRVSQRATSHKSQITFWKRQTSPRSQ